MLESTSSSRPKKVSGFNAPSSSWMVHGQLRKHGIPSASKCFQSAQTTFRASLFADSSGAFGETSTRTTSPSLDVVTVYFGALPNPYADSLPLRNSAYSSTARTESAPCEATSAAGSTRQAIVSPIAGTTAELACTPSLASHATAAARLCKTLHVTTTAAAAPVHAPINIAMGHFTAIGRPPTERTPQIPQHSQSEHRQISPTRPSSLASCHPETAKPRRTPICERGPPQSSTRAVRRERRTRGSLLTVDSSRKRTRLPCAHTTPADVRQRRTGFPPLRASPPARQ